jgi:ADP-ribose pyrophosphatase YjhB (NUDIX family)
MVSEIQGKILAMIARSDGMRYSEAYPGEGIDDDLYNYHLQELVKKKLLFKENGKYNLTDDGVKENLLFDSLGVRQDTFRLSVILVVTRNNKQEILIHKRLRQPYLGEVSTISGKVKEGEKLIDTAKRKLIEEAGLVAEFSHWGNWRSIRRTVDNKIIEDTIYCVCVAENPTGELIKNNEFGENRWEIYENIFEYLDKNVATGEIEKQILKEIKRGKIENREFEEEIVLGENYRVGTR